MDPTSLEPLPGLYLHVQNIISHTNYLTTVINFQLHYSTIYRLYYVILTLYLYQVIRYR